MSDVRRSEEPARPQVPEVLPPRPAPVGIDRFRRLLNARRDESTPSLRALLEPSRKDGASRGDDGIGDSPAAEADAAGLAAGLLDAPRAPHYVQHRSPHHAPHHAPADAPPRRPPEGPAQPTTRGPGQHGQPVDNASTHAAQLPIPQPQPQRATTPQDGADGRAKHSESAWCRDAAVLIGGLCARAGEFECWSATVPLDATVLPETLLRIDLSHHWLSLRFSTQSPVSTRLISAHGDRLRQLLETLPGLPRDIGIELA